MQEALRAGRPLVASRTGGIPDLTGEDAAVLVPPGDAAALAAAVLAVLDDPGLAARLGEAARARAAALPGEAAAVDAALALYRAGPPGGKPLDRRLVSTAGLSAMNAAKRWIVPCSTYFVSSS